MKIYDARKDNREPLRKRMEMIPVGTVFSGIFGGSTRKRIMYRADNYVIDLETNVVWSTSTDPRTAERRSLESARSFQDLYGSVLEYEELDSCLTISRTRR